MALLLGAFALLLLTFGLRAFSRASVADIRSLLAWTAAMAGLTLMVLLVLTGKGPFALFALSLGLPLARQWWAARSHPTASSGSAGRGGGAMTEQEALEVLGLRPAAAEAEIRAAHRRLMQAVHPDRGGSDWVSARVNQARDILLRKRASGRG